MTNLQENDHYEFGGFFFAIGSFGYIIHDVIEFWLDWNHLSSNEDNNEFKNDPDDGNIHWDFIFNLHGSTLYLIGCIMFIPEIDLMTTGLYICIYASSVIILIECFRLYKLGCVNHSIKGFSIANWKVDLQDVYSTIGLIFADVLYLVGCIYFLPQYDVSTRTNNVASLCFVVGSVIITFSAISHTFHFGESIHERPISRKIYSPAALRRVGYFSPMAYRQRDNSPL